MGHTSSPRRRWPWIVLGAVSLLAAISGAAMGYFMKLDLPDVLALEDYRPPEMSRVVARDGRLLGTFAEQRRILLRADEIPKVLEQALIATEDSNFYRHTGIDLKGILRALWRDLATLSMAEGASTLTQQLARNLFLHADKTIHRKIQEAVLALEIERQFTKPEILRFYCNQIYTGHGRWGVEAASRLYFGKPARDLSLSEAATLAGLIQRPESLSPLKYPDRAIRRRNHVLARMVNEGMISPRESAEATEQPLVVAGAATSSQKAPYFVEEVRRWVQQRYGSSALYQDGLEVHTTLDLRLQEFAERAMDLGLRELDKRQGWRGIQTRIPDGETPETFEAASWKGEIVEGRVYDGVVTAVTSKSATVRVADRAGVLGRDEIKWTKKKTLSALLTAGDLIRVRIRSVGDGARLELSLEQEPIAEAALIAIEPQTGAVRALIGGFDFERSEFDRAMQARRQTGSAFKPLIYAAALADGWTLADTLLDEPTVFLDRKNPEPYQPENYSNKYYETVTLRRALEKSANISTVKLLNAVGYEKVIGTAHRLGIKSPLQPFPSLALGVFGTRLIELTSAYGSFANAGVLVTPHLVDEVHDTDGEVIDRIEPKVTDAVGPQVAYLMNRVLRGVITDGTGKGAKYIRHAIAGKTGTTDNNTDAWFIGYSPGLAVGVWVGFDEPRSLGSRETGALAALPIWREFMERALEDEPSLEFETPPGITIVSIDRDTGLKATQSAGCRHVFSEAFVSGTEPTEYCSKQHHRRLMLPYPFQRYALDENGRLSIPEGDLERLLSSELDAYLIDRGTRLEVYTAAGLITMPVAIVPGGAPTPIPARIREEYDISRWVGKDGRPAEVLWLN